MLGEDHSLLHEFPQYEDTITRLMDSDAVFASDTRHYNALDKEIRTLELRGGPIEDTEMTRLKLERAGLKDSLYQRLSSEAP